MHHTQVCDDCDIFEVRFSNELDELNNLMEIFDIMRSLRYIKVIQVIIGHYCLCVSLSVILSLSHIPTGPLYTIDHLAPDALACRLAVQR